MTSYFSYYKVWPPTSPLFRDFVLTLCGERHLLAYPQKDDVIYEPTLIPCHSCYATWLCTGLLLHLADFAGNWFIKWQKTTLSPAEKAGNLLDILTSSVKGFNMFATRSSRWLCRCVWQVFPPRWLLQTFVYNTLYAQRIRRALSTFFARSILGRQCTRLFINDVIFYGVTKRWRSPQLMTKSLNKGDRT